VNPPVAAVDVGTNSVRLLVLDAAGQRVTRRMTITRLGYGVDRTGHLDDDALARTLDTIAGYHDVWREHGVEHVRIAATSAVRDASDRDRFFDGVRDITGVDAEVITGDEEARTAYLGASRGVDVARPLTVLDIGGGSTELIVGTAEDTVGGAVSLQLGCVRLTERVLTGDPPGPDAMAAASHEIAARLDEADDVLGDRRVGDTATLVGVAGTITTLAALHLGLDRYDEDAIHATSVPAAAVRAWSDRLLAMTSAERAGLGAIQAGREDVIAAGVLIVRHVVERYGFDAIVASEADGLDGLAASLRIA
jgi:exopolyphosphatase / guanosine-5'-triphosphate,3'-diphosphate pyrophosphatase